MSSIISFVSTLFLLGAAFGSPVPVAERNGDLAGRGESVVRIAWNGNGNYYAYCSEGPTNSFGPGWDCPAISSNFALDTSGAPTHVEMADKRGNCWRSNGGYNGSPVEWASCHEGSLWKVDGDHIKHLNDDYSESGFCVDRADNKGQQPQLWDCIGYNDHQKFVIY